MKIVFDTNVVLDVLLKREPYAEVAISLFAAVEQELIQGFLCATTITTVDYLVAKAKDKSVTKQATNHLLRLFSIAEVNQSILKAAVDSPFEDFEDAVLYEAGCYAAVDGFVTRNIKDFKKAERPLCIVQMNYGLLFEASSYDSHRKLHPGWYTKSQTNQGKTSYVSQNTNQPSS